jgi:pimeloyl-ACP methyl ester carboxylesterase
MAEFAEERPNPNVPYSLWPLPKSLTVASGACDIPHREPGCGTPPPTRIIYEESMRVQEGQGMHPDGPQPASIATNHGTVEYASLGEGPAVLSLHGAAGGYDQGLILARTIGSPGFRFLAVSRPGYFGTPLAVGPTPDAQADAVAALLDALGIRTAAVMAVSGGGPCALQFSLRHPQRCWALVMASACSAPLVSRPPLSFRLLPLIVMGEAASFVSFLTSQSVVDAVPFSTSALGTVFAVTKGEKVSKIPGTAY